MTLPAFAPDEVSPTESIRSTRLKWVILVDDAIARGLLVNAVACIAASVGDSIQGLIGPEAEDAAGVTHAGLPWTGCTVLAASTEQLEQIRTKAAAHEDMFVADMPAAAQSNRVYDDYRTELAGTEHPGTIALALIGPRNAVDRLVKRLPLLA